MKRRVLFLLTMCAAFALASFSPGDDGPSKRTLLVIDKTGKEVKVKSWKFIGGTVHLSWLARKTPEVKENKDNKDNKDNKNAKEDKKPKAPLGPEALEFRELKSTDYANGIKTLIPFSSIRQIDYDNEKKTVAVTLMTADDKDLVLNGETRYVGINKLTIEAEAIIGDLGVAAVKFQGGNPKDGIRGLRLDQAKAIPAAAGTTATVIATDKEKHTVFDLQPLYKTGDGRLQISPTLYFKTTVKVDVARLKKLRHIEPENKKQASSDFEITLQDGQTHMLTLLDRDPSDTKAPALVGLLGRVPAGYKLFPAHTIKEAQFEGKKE